MSDELTAEEIEEQESVEFEEAFAAFASGEEPPESDEVDPDGDQEEQELSGEEEPDELTTLKAENEKLLHQNNSANGRISGLQLKINELTRKVEDVTTTPPAAAEEEPQEEDDESWNEIKEDFPEIAEAVEKRISKMSQTVEAKIDPLVTSNEERTKADQQARESEELEKLEEIHPDWRESISGQEFSDWYLKQPAKTQDLYGSLDSADSINLLNLFHVDHPKAGGESQDDNEADDEKIAALKEKRDKQLSKGRSVQTKQRGQRTDSGGGDFAADFAAFAKIKDKQRQDRQAAGHHF